MIEAVSGIYSVSGDTQVQDSESVIGNWESAVLPRAHRLFRHADHRLGRDLDAGLLKVLVTTGVHDDECDGLVLHHVEQLLRRDAPCRRSGH